MDDPVGGVDHEEEDEASEIQNKKKVISRDIISRINSDQMR